MRGRTSRASSLVALLAFATLPVTGCKSGASGGATKGSASPAEKPAAVPGKLVPMVSPSRLLPDVRGDRGVIAYEAGARRVLVDRMRLVTYEDGRTERANELLPLGHVRSVELPSRLGGGFVFHATSGGGTQLWRASSWLGKLRPLVQFSSTTTDVVPGFDRLYLRLASNGKLVAVDTETGEVRSLAPLPPAAAYGGLAFADGFSGVVDADLRGVLATFDAGATWRPLHLPERPAAISVVDGEPTMFVTGGKYVLDARGNLTYRASQVATDDEGDDTTPAAPKGPFGKKVLRAAVEDGFPDSPRTAVVARQGALARVSLDTGAIVDLNLTAFPEREASCHATRVGASYGFVCGEREGPTNVYTFAPPLVMKKVLSFKGPRFVSPNGQGALVVRGPCGEEDAGAASDTRVYCVRAASGATREVRVKGDLGVERVVALSDERVAILVPPRAGSTGQLTILKGSDMTNVPLVLPQKPRSVARELRRGMWLEGFEEREPGVLGGWVEAGGPVIGVRVKLDGAVTAGEARDNENGVVVSGRFALSQGEGGRSAESTDGGMTWKVFDMPEHDVAPGDAPTRACGPVGCVLAGWVRVGWGKPAISGDLRAAEAPPSLYVPMKTTPTVRLTCAHVGKPVTEPLPDKPVKKAPTPPPRSSGTFGMGGFGGFGGFGRVSPQPLKTPWSTFRNMPAPTLDKDEIGIDNGAPYDLVSLRAYAWGKKGSDWARTGHFLVRFDDRFDPAGGVRSTATSAPPWPDESATADGMGIGSYPLASWGSFLDPSGRHALSHVCRGTSCSLLAASEGQPVLLLRDAAGRTTGLSRPLPLGAVRVGESWFFLAQGTSYDMVSLYRVDLGVIRLVSSFHRPSPSRYTMPEPPRLVRRALGTGLGLLVTSIPEPGERFGGMYVHPVDPETGVVSEPIALGKRDLGGALPPRCVEGQDGWILDTSLDVSPSLETPGGRGTFDSVEMRLRLDPGQACVEGIAARLDGTFLPHAEAKARPADRPAQPAAVPLAATERSTGRRWSFVCSRR
ncbi:hypothetical protein [Polyangium spumosum]|uniref:Photosynthesis system II assembly factor Ycf48/Hcf136-like domain-containing protein n=1 Tax=Polyangium spumosum TaxID=889282 RepID=A0A6N7PN08_9BACT|nr:hypothetical protein [Polyangium spumosum]MRG93542.1 hypothetical protein [Polyangium spumosum]